MGPLHPGSWRRRWTRRFAVPGPEEGDAAPVWTTVDAHGHVRHLDDRWQILLFPGPRGHREGLFDELRRLAPRFDALGVVAWCWAPPRAAVPVDLPSCCVPVEDPGAHIARAYGARVVWPILGERPLAALALVNPSRKIRVRHLGVPAIEPVLRTVEALTQATRAGA